MGASPHSAGGPGLSGTTADLKARPASAASDSKDTGSEKDETAAAAAAAVFVDGAAVLPRPPTKSVRSLTSGEGNVAGNLGAQAASLVLARAAARAKDVKRIFAADQHGEALLPSSKYELLGVGLGHSGQHRQGRDPGEQYSPST